MYAKYKFTFTHTHAYAHTLFIRPKIKSIRCEERIQAANSENIIHTYKYIRIILVSPIRTVAHLTWHLASLHAHTCTQQHEQENKNRSKISSNLRSLILFFSSIQFYEKNPNK